ncbi:T-protein [Acidipropionibacterium virtanenii]|uniref:T-protein n=2 Tax=Acidipropionibacterium virtanenii TaxID=2057246 RepID=A0A344USF5_9ACTN|nr:T-protein [Acidipropionibacterium virtanenii]
MPSDADGMTLRGDRAVPDVALTGGSGPVRPSRPLDATLGHGFEGSGTETSRYRGDSAGASNVGGMSEVHPELAELRNSIDNMDAALIHLLAERFKITQRVGVLKATQGLPPADPEREKEQVARLRRLAEASHLDPEFAEKFISFIVAEVVRHHADIAEAHQRIDPSV